MSNFDDHATGWINSLAGHNSAMDGLVINVSTWAVPILVLAVALQWWAGDDRRANRHTLISAGLSFGLALSINQLILLIVHRVRPYDAGVTHLLIEKSNDPSFPSDHATAAAAIAAAFLFHLAPRRAAFFGVAAILVGFSRVYIGTHYCGDVLGGALTGLLGAWIVGYAYQPDTKLDRLVTGIL